jgi:radical SAM protein with 4Fe4S-binding SPASM domain
MSTNATLLRGGRAKDLLGSGLSCLVLSVDGATAETYESLRVGAKFDETLDNISSFLDWRKNLGEGPRIVFQLIEMEETRNEVEEFRRRWEPYLEAGDEISIKRYNNWSDRHRDGPRDLGIAFRTPCFAFLWDFLAVTWDGTVLPCCYDSEGELSLGSFPEQTLEQIWNGKRLRELRDAHTRLDFESFPICARCDNTTEILDVARLKRVLRRRLRARNRSSSRSIEQLTELP